MRRRSPLLLSPAFAAMLPLVATAAHAQVTTLQASGSYSLNNGPVTNAPQTGSLGAGSVDVIAFPTDGSSNAGLHSYGSSNGNFGSRSSGYGVYQVNGGFRIVETFTNTSGQAANAVFNFNITPGFLQNDVRSVLTGSQFVESGISFAIKRDGNAVWGSNAALHTDVGGTSFTSGGTNLYTPNPGNATYYAILGGMQSISLGTLGVGESLTLDYELRTYANGDGAAGAPVVVPDRTFIVGEQYVKYCQGSRSGYATAAAAHTPTNDDVQPFLVFNPGGGYGNDYPCSNARGGEVQLGDTITVKGYTIPGQASGSHASSGDPFQINTTTGQPNYQLNNGRDPFGASITLAAVPEPSTYALTAAGVALVALVVRRRRGAVMVA